MKKIILSVFAVAMLAACNTSVSDVTKPVINLTSPADNDTVYAGDDHGMHLDMELSDDIALGSYKIDIHNADDGHTHNAPSRHSETNWSFAKSWDDIEDKVNAHVHHHEILIPVDAKVGKYHFIVYCTDKAGNESHVVKNIYIAEHNEDHDH